MLPFPGCREHSASAATYSDCHGFLGPVRSCLQRKAPVKTGEWTALSRLILGKEKPGSLSIASHPKLSEVRRQGYRKISSFPRLSGEGTALPQWRAMAAASLAIRWVDFDFLLDIKGSFLSGCRDPVWRMHSQLLKLWAQEHWPVLTREPQSSFPVLSTPVDTAPTASPALHLWGQQFSWNWLTHLPFTC